MTNGFGRSGTATANVGGGVKEALTYQAPKIATTNVRVRYHFIL
jgi:hypothetical protein